MKVFVPKETSPEEARIPLLPVDSGKLVQLGAQAEVEAGITKDGYCKQLTEEQLDIQRKAMAKQCAQSNVVNPAAGEDQSSPLWGMPKLRSVHWSLSSSSSCMVSGTRIHGCP